MKRTTGVVACGLSVLLLCLSLSGATGCDRETAAQVAVLSGTYLGDVVSTVTTQYWLDLLGVEADGDADAHAHDADGHAHDAEPMHDHEH